MLSDIKILYIHKGYVNSYRWLIDLDYFQMKTQHFQAKAKLLKAETWVLLVPATGNEDDLWSHQPLPMEKRGLLELFHKELIWFLRWRLSTFRMNLGWCLENSTALMALRAVCSMVFIKLQTIFLYCFIFSLQAKQIHIIGV